MINMVKADLFRITKSIAFYIAIAIMLIMCLISLYIIEPGSIGQVPINDVNLSQSSQETVLDGMSFDDILNLSMSDIREMMLKSENYDLDRDILGTNMNLYYIFIFIAAIAITVDFSSGSVKNTLSSAINRKKYFLSKTFFVLGSCTVLFFANTYIVYFGNLLINGKNLASDLWTVTKISLFQFPVMLAMMSILVGIAFMVKKTSIYNIITIPFIMVFQIILSLVITVFNLDDKIFDYEFQVMITKLASFPDGNYIIKSVVICFGIALVFLSLGYLSFRKTEIK